MNTTHHDDWTAEVKVRACRIPIERDDKTTWMRVVSRSLFLDAEAPRPVAQC